MSLRVVFRPAAKAEYEEAAAWYEKQSPGLGEEFLREMDDVISSAAEYPARYPMGDRGCAQSGGQTIPVFGFLSMQGRYTCRVGRVPWPSRPCSLAAADVVTKGHE